MRRDTISKAGVLVIGLLFFNAQLYAWSKCAKMKVTIDNNSQLDWKYSSVKFCADGCASDGSSSNQYSYDGDAPPDISSGVTGSSFIIQGPYDQKMEAYITYQTSSAPYKTVTFYVERDKRKSGHYHIPARADVDSGRGMAQELDVRHAYCDDPNKTSDHSYYAQAYFQLLDSTTKLATVNLVFNTAQQQALATKKALTGLDVAYFDGLDMQNYKPFSVQVDPDDARKASYIFEIYDEYTGVDTYQD